MDEKKLLEFVQYKGHFLETAGGDAQAIVEIIMLIKEKGFSVSYASSILNDVITLLPKIAKV